MICFWKIKVCMGVINFLVRVDVRKHKSNLPTNIRTTVGKKTQWYVEKCNLLSENTLLPYVFYNSMHMVYFLLPKRVFFYQWCLSCFSSQQYIFLWFCKTVLVKKYTPCQGMIWFSLTNVISFTLALCGTLTSQWKPH